MIPFRESVKETVLSNGLRVITDHYDLSDDHPDKGYVYASLICTGGSLHDPETQNGLAHFAEHMIVYAHPNMTQKDFNQKGNRFLREFNLSTRLCHTEYYGFGLKEHVTTYLTDIFDAMKSLAYTEQDCFEERRRIQHEMARFLTDPVRLSRYEARKLFFKEEVHGKWIGGYPTHFEKIGIEDIRAYHTRLHVPNGMTIVTSGSLSHEEVCACVEQYLGGLHHSEPFPLLESQFVPSKGVLIAPYKHHPETGHVADINISYDCSDLSQKELWALLLLGSYTNIEIHERLCHIGIYGMSMKPAKDIRRENVFEIACEALSKDKLISFIYTISNGITSSVLNIDEDIFLKKKKDLSDGHRQMIFSRGGNPEFRAQTIISRFIDGQDLCGIDDILGIIDSLNPADIKNVMEKVFSREPAILYRAATDFDLPTGPDIQQVWKDACTAIPIHPSSVLTQAFSDQNRSSIVSNPFDIKENSLPKKGASHDYGR